MINIAQTLAKVFLATGVAATAAGCANNAQTGALVGGAGGAGLGAIIGSMSHARAGEGALIGGAVGALGGYIIGNEADKSEQRQRERHYVERPRYYAPPPAYGPPPTYYAPPPPPRYQYERFDYRYEEHYD